MFKFDNTHIFTGYLKQLLSSVNIPTCKIYTDEFARYLEEHRIEDPRIIESFDTVNDNRIAVRVNYLKNNEIYTYSCDYSDELGALDRDRATWKRTSTAFYDKSKFIPGLTKTLNSPGSLYDVETHEYLGEYLRFLRDYHKINLMSMYNCFNNKICNNAYFAQTIKPGIEPETEEEKAKWKSSWVKVTFDPQDPKYCIYAVPVKLFATYTIAIDCSQGIEMFCGLYNTNLDISTKSVDLFIKTYKKFNKTVFNQPFLYDSLDVKKWTFEADNNTINSGTAKDTITRWDIMAREQDLKLFIKIPASCRSSIVILEGDFRYFNNFKYAPAYINDNHTWIYKQNHSVVNFGNKNDLKKVDLNTSGFKPISKLQLLAFNTRESYPFADRLIEYLTGSTITPIDEIPDNIMRAQKVMQQNKHHFKIAGLWENKMQKIIYDYVMNAGPIVTEGDRLIDKHSGHNPKYYGYQPTIGHKNKSTLYDILGYIDKDAEKWYASWEKDKNKNKAKVRNTIHSVDIYDGLYDI